MRVFLRALMSLIRKPSKADKIQGILNSGVIPACHLSIFLDGLVRRTILRVQGRSGNAAWENWANHWLSGEDKTAKAVSVLLREAERSQGHTWVAAWSACGVWADSWIASNVCLSSWRPDDDSAVIEYVNRVISSSLRLLRDVTPVGFEVAYQTEVEIQYKDLLKLIKETSDENCYKDNQGHVLRRAA